MSSLVKILIVEDDASLAQQFKWYLKKEHEVSVASTKEDAQRALRKESYHVALFDLGLPPHPENPTVGLSLLQEAVETYPALKVIVMTAHGDQQTAREALSLGAYDFLVKPVDEHLLDTLIRRAFYRQKLEAEFSDEPHVRGTLSMARTADPNSADSQFFIVFARARHLDGKYTVWGQVTKGMSAVSKIKRGDGGNGMVDDPDSIIRMQVMADVKE